MAIIEQMWRILFHWRLLASAPSTLRCFRADTLLSWLFSWAKWHKSKKFNYTYLRCHTPHYNKWFFGRQNAFVAENGVKITHGKNTQNLKSRFISRIERRKAKKNGYWQKWCGHSFNSIHVRWNRKITEELPKHAHATQQHLCRADRFLKCQAKEKIAKTSSTLLRMLVAVAHSMRATEWQSKRQKRKKSIISRV